MSPVVGDKLKLMVVDDEPDNLDLLYRTFRRDFSVYKADSGFAALEVLEREGEMAVIVSDQRMPGMNGTEFLSKTVDRFPDTIRIILTGYTDVEDLVGAINSGKVFRYLTKPWNPDELKRVVSQAGETYRVVKRRTDELNRALRRESLFNTMMSAIRGSLDYDSMLPTIAQAIGQSFQTQGCSVRAVEEHQLQAGVATYPTPATIEPDPTATPGGSGYLLPGLPETMVDLALTELKLQEEAATAEAPASLTLPLVFQKECLAVLGAVRDRSWQTDELHLLQELAEQAALALSQARLYQRSQAQMLKFRQELELARQVQSDLLPQQCPEVPGVRLQARCRSAQEVGGDFFEAIRQANGDIWVAVGDVSGKGVSAALFMASAISILRQELSQSDEIAPDEVLRRLNQSLSDNLFNSNKFITMALARYRPSEHQLAYANAGHVYPLIWSPGRGGDPLYLKARGVPLGILPVWKGQGDVMQLTPGQALLLASDGITEATVSGLPGLAEAADEAGSVMLRQEGLWTLLAQQPMPFDLDHLLTTLEHYAPQQQEDDQTLLSLEVL